MTDIFENMPLKTYLAHAGMSHGQLGNGRISWKYMRWALDHPDMESTPAKQMGSAVRSVTRHSGAQVVVVRAD